jgi:signal transduction histidine kinase/DNA-binding response OmpR family regulator/ligand-binding sensor domain-containing protein
MTYLKEIAHVRLYHKRGFLYFALSIITILTCHQASAQPFAYQFNHLTVDEGLSHTDANCVVQDQKGFIWIGTFFGITRFDGYNVKRYYNSNMPLQNAYNNRIKYMLPDDCGLIWLSTEGGLQLFDAKIEKYTAYTIKGLTRQPTFNKLIKEGNHRIYNLSDGRLNLYLIKDKHLIAQTLPLPKDVVFDDMRKDMEGNIILTSGDGVYVLNKQKTFRRLQIPGYTAAGDAHIYINRTQQLLISHSNRVYLLRQIGDHNFTVKRVYIGPGLMHFSQVGEDSKGNYWVNGNKGLINLNQDIKPIQIVTDQTPGVGLHTRSLTDLLIDRSDCLWVTSFGSGVSYRDLNGKKFLTFQHRDDDANSITANYVRCILEQPHKGLWIGTENGLNFYDYQSKRNMRYDRSSSVALKNSSILSLAFDRDSNLWIGTAAGLNILEADRRSLIRPPGYETFPSYSIETLARDFYGNMWFGNHTNSFGVIWRDDHNNSHTRYYGEGYFILPEEKKPELFISSTNGLKRIFVDQKGLILKTHYYRAGKNKGLSSDYTYPIAKQSDRVYWVGTIGGGLNKLTLGRAGTYTVKTYNAKSGVFNDVESLEIDVSGRIWMGGNGLLCFNPKTEQLIRYDKNDGLQGNSFKVGASYKGADGKLYFGGINGLNYFDPSSITSLSAKVHPILTDLLINNERPHYGQTDQGEASLPQVITYTKHLKLDYQQNNFVIAFSAMHFGNPIKCRYRYKLVGYDKAWKYTDGKNASAFYSNLDYNNYHFFVEATNPDGVWTKERANVVITVTPPWWKSSLAKIVYLVLFISGLMWLYIYQARWYQLKKELAVRAVNETKREEMHAQKELLYQQQLQFFTNISHELRTPLTLILGPLETLINDHKQGPLAASFQLMFRNIKRLVNLINELMNFKKMADEAIRLHVQELNIIDFSEGVFREFEPLASSKHIDLRFAHGDFPGSYRTPTSFFDAQILEKILFNLLSNALKYTEDGGSVNFRVFFDKKQFKSRFNTSFHLLNEQYRAHQYVYFLIADTGIGISEASISHIFDRYYQIGTNHLGSGVGLALVKSLCQLHKGDISVYSERNKGTEFLVALPWGGDNYTSGEHLRTEAAYTSHLERIDILPLSASSPTLNKRNEIAHTIDKHILLVDDNAELRTFLKQALGKFYFIAEASDGEEAVRLATERSPDLIISDVMMPGISGIELCQRIKEKFETSHIPFIILSAKDALETKIEGMHSGADYYFAKPFSIDLLILTIHNLFQQSQKLKLKYTRDYLTSATELVHNEKDREFMNKLLDLIESNLEDPALDVDFLCDHLFISRSKLYQKIKNISDQSIGDFIKTIRLKKAIQLMTHEAIPLNEVAHRSGFQSQGYFSRVFRKEFGCSPSEYIRDLLDDRKFN